ncbi:MAG: D-glycero-beta-D-manno-heptose-7-phosphate kinase [Candidatus Marinimicrobia bacterium]|nr:D-glycero-beta-D-manno-heptose-7-phosphate kinase [Candidatus Neomarinimicrobiota bacterium]
MSPYNDLSKNTLRSLFKDISSLNILVIGDLILDNYIWGSVNRISPEAPVPVIQVKTKENRLGGAGNVAANLASLGSKVTLAGICGDDNYKNVLSELCNHCNIKPLIQEIPNRQTTLKSRVIAQHQQLIRIDNESCEPIQDTTATVFYKKIVGDSEQYDGVIISDYNKGLLTVNLTSDILKHFSGRPVIVDPKSNDFSKYHGATTLKPNRKEFASAIRHPDLKDDEVGEYAKKLVSDLELEGLVITLGDQGVFVLDNNHKSLTVPTKAREVFDVSGAGDTFIATFLAGLILTDNWFTAAKAANLASGVVVAKIGTATVTIDEIFTNYEL